MKRGIATALAVGACAAATLTGCTPDGHDAPALYVGAGYVLVDLDPVHGYQLESSPAGVQVIHYGDPLPACPAEDAAGPCFWNAAGQGNGQGRSFYVDADGIHYVGVDITAQGQ